MNIFNSVKGLHPRRNSFSAHTYRNDFTSTLGLNIPVYLQHVPPATRVKVSTSALIRLQALTAPIMDNIDFYVHFWQIPYRLLEKDKFTQFISGEIDPEDYVGLFATPNALAQKIAEKCLIFGDKMVSNYQKIVGNGSLLDFCGYDQALFATQFTVDDDDNVTLSDDGNDWKTFNFRNLIAYYMLHVNWYMNENVPYFTNFVDQVNQLSVQYGDDALDFLAQLLVNSFRVFGTTLLPHAWEKDYFTSALPNVQYGDPVSLPIAGTAPVSIPAQNGLAVTFASLLPPNSEAYTQWGDNENPLIKNEGGYSYLYSTAINPVEPDDDDILPITGMNVKTPALSGATADLSEATAITINELRFANALQVFKERQMRYGRRRLEHYKGFLM